MRAPIVALALALCSFTPTASLAVLTVAALPTCNAAVKGTQYMVTDALTPVALASVVGGGAVNVPVTCNGTAWIVG